MEQQVFYISSEGEIDVKQYFASMTGAETLEALRQSDERMYQDSYQILFDSLKYYKVTVEEVPCPKD